MTTEEQREYETTKFEQRKLAAKFAGVVAARIGSGQIAADDALAGLLAEWEALHETTCRLTGATNESAAAYGEARS